MISVLLGLLITSGTSMEISGPACPPGWFDRDTLRNILRTDSSTRGVTKILLEIRQCDAAPETFEVTVTRSDRQQMEHRQIAVQDAARPLRLRVLALGISELLRAPPSPPPRRVAIPPAEVSPGPSAAETAAIDSSDEVSSRGAAALSVHSMLRHGHPLFGGKLSFLWARSPRDLIEVQAALEAVVGSASADTGQVQLGLVSVETGVAVRTFFGEASLGVGPFGRAGVAWASGDPRSEAAVGDFGAAGHVGLGALVAVSAPLTTSADLRVELRAEHAIAGVRAIEGDAAVTGTDGPSLGAALGLVL